MHAVLVGFNIDSYMVFLELLPDLHITLQAMICSCHFMNLGTDCRWDGEALTKANGFSTGLRPFPFCSVLGFYLKS